ncbi:MAG TPA: ATP-binding protein, partial [Acidimicrobiia bacterium]|nr:ATP-binding protein [Acidimicrobiia bacterium]
LATVRARTVAGASVALGIALLLSASTAGALLRRSLIRSLDEVAEVRAADVASLAYDNGRDLPQGIASHNGEIIQVVAPDGRVLASSLPAATTEPLSPLRPAPGRFVTATVERLGGDVGAEGRYRLLALRGTGSPDPPIVYVASGLGPVEHSVDVLSRLVFLGLPALLALVALTAWLAVGRALRPVEAIRAELADISARDLDRRVPQSGAGDEVDRLARTMNAMLDRLEASTERQRRFVADASDELVAPLAAIRDRLESGLEAPPEGGWPATGAELLRQHRRMERLVRDLLYLARADAGAPRAPAAAVDLDDVVLAEVTRLRSTYSAGDPPTSGPGPIRFETAAVSAAPIEGRPEDLRRAVRNLLEHAERHAASTVRVGLWAAEDGAVTLVVEDDGTEALPAERDLVFERFTRVPFPAESGTGEPGSGLALAIVRDIAVAHGGHVAVEAADPGARFILHLPAGPPA